MIHTLDIGEYTLAMAKVISSNSTRPVPETIGFPPPRPFVLQVAVLAGVMKKSWNEVTVVTVDGAALTYNVDLWYELDFFEARGTIVPQVCDAVVAWLLRIVKERARRA